MPAIQKAYDQWSDIYDSNDNKTRDLDKKVTQLVLSNYSFSNILEIGCGTGKNTEWLANHADHVIALDASAGMLEKAKAKIKSNKVTFNLADLNNSWNVPSDSFDLISCNLVLEHIENLNHIFSEAFRVLKQDSLFFICELHPFKQYAGTQARFETDEGTQLVDAFLHHTTEYTNTAKAHGFDLIDLVEWFDDDNADGIPRLISFVFKKIK